MMLTDLAQTLMRALEQHPSLERSIFLLHNVFGVPVEEVAARLNLDPEAVRELMSRVRLRVQEAHLRSQVGLDEGSRGDGPSYQ